MITILLTILVIWCLFYGQIPLIFLVLLCLGFGAILALLGKHKHTHFFTIDVLAQTSNLNMVNPSLKFWTSLMLMVICISANSPVVGFFIFILILFLIVFIGGLKLHDYINLLSLPVSFLMISGLALLFEVTNNPIGILNINIWGFWFCVTKSAQIRAALVISRALGAVSCLYLLSLTTPMSELIGVLRHVHCPSILIDLMYLIYRYIFILTSMYYTMKDAAKSRLGFADYKTSLRTSGNIYSNLLIRSYKLANRNFDAMESRCYDTEIRFLENRQKVTKIQAITSFGIILFTLCLSLLLH